MKIPLIKIIGEAIESSARDYLRAFVRQRYSDYLTAHTINLDEMPVTTLWRFTGGDKMTASSTLYGIDGMYLYKLRDNFKAVIDQEATINFSEFHIKSVFMCFGYQEEKEEFVAFLIRYIKALDIPWNLKDHQVIEIRKVYFKADKNGKIPNLGEIADWIDKKEMAAFKHRLAGENGAKWYLYFYGYELLENPKKSDKTWPLVRLVLDFKPSRGDKDMPVFITNTEHPHHHDYKGHTDLDSSTKKVLVLNLKTFEHDPKRQLNIKLFVDTAFGSLFMGQYLNYEVAKGRIISGDLIMEQVKIEPEQKDIETGKQKEIPVIPLTFDIKEPLQDTDGYESIKHLKALIPLLKLRFRETKPAIYNSFDQEWQISNFI